MSAHTLKALFCGFLWLVALASATPASAQDAPAEPPPVAADSTASPASPATTDASTNADADRARAQTSWQGASGGVHLIDAGSGLPGSVRLQLGFDYFRGSDYLAPGDTNENLSGTLPFAFTPAEHLEVFGTFSTHANSNNHGNPVLIQIVGDVLLGVKGFTNVTPWLGLGADMRAVLVNNVGDLGVALDGTNLGLRTDATADFRHLDDGIPLLVRANIDYLFDNSGALVQDVENARYRALPPSSRRARINEDRNLVTRIERLALGINRVDMLTFALGAEVPLRVADDWFVHPLAEWSIGLPINRQGYNCLSVATHAGVGDPDGCLAVAGVSAAPSVLTLGARLLPPVRGLSALLAFDIGVRGTSTFVRELAPTKPWALLLALSLAADNQALPAPVAVAPAPPAAAAPAVARPRVRGIVVDAQSGAPIPDATVRYSSLELNPQLTAVTGEFISYELDPGEVSFEVSHPDYDSRTCTAVVPGAGVPATGTPSAALASQPSAAANAPQSGLVPIAETSPDGATIPAVPAAAAVEPQFVPMRCELTAKPRNGRVTGSVTGANNAPLRDLQISVMGPVLRTFTTDASGNFASEDLPVGEYSARVETLGYLPAALTFKITSGAVTTLPIALVSKSKEEPAVAPAAPAAKPQVIVTNHEVKIRKQIMFMSNSAQIDERSNPLLEEIASVLNQNPQVKHVQVQGHTDNKGDPGQNLSLSQGRAEAVVAKLIASGVDASRLEAKGYGDSRPLVPNLTPGNRAQNRRVQFIITAQ